MKKCNLHKENLDFSCVFFLFSDTDGVPFASFHSDSKYLWWKKLLELEFKFKVVLHQILNVLLLRIIDAEDAVMNIFANKLLIEEFETKSFQSFFLFLKFCLFPFLEKKSFLFSPKPIF